METQSPHELRDATPHFHFRSGNDMAELYAQMVTLKKEGRAITGSRGGLPIAELSHAIDKAVRMIRTQLREDPRLPLSDRKLDSILANHGITSASNLRLSVQRTIQAMHRAGDLYRRAPDEAKLLAYLTSTGAFHPVNALPEDRFRLDYPRDVQAEDHDLREAVQRRWRQLDANDRAEVSGQEKRQRQKHQSEVGAWLAERQKEFYDERDIVAMSVLDDDRYENCIQTNRLERERTRYHAQELDNSRYSVGAVVSRLADEEGTREESRVRSTDFSANGVRKMKASQGGAYDVFVRTRLFDFVDGHDRTVFGLNWVSLLESGRFEDPEAFVGTIIELTQVAGQSGREIRDLIDAKKRATGRIDAASVLRPMALRALRELKEWLSGYESLVKQQTGIALRLTRTIEEQYGV